MAKKLIDIDVEMLEDAKRILGHPRSTSTSAATVAPPTRFLVTDQEAWDRALDVQRRLAARSSTRAVAVNDLLVAAVAELHRVVVLHYDADFDHVAEITGQRIEWSYRAA